MKNLTAISTRRFGLVTGAEVSDEGILFKFDTGFELFVPDKSLKYLDMRFYTSKKLRTAV